MEEKPLVYQFDDVRVDVRDFKILKAGQPLSLEPKAFEVLVFLIRHSQRLVEKNELLDAVWKETFVTPNALTRVIAHLRRALGDDTKEAKYILTVPTRGYRFIADVQIDTAADNGNPQPDPGEAFEFEGWGLRKTRAQMVALICVGLALLLALVVLWRFQTRRETVEPPGVIKTAQITATQGMDLFPAFSPDGGMIAYSSLRKGAFEIIIRQLAPGGREIQVTSDGEQNLQPAWSPDGKMIAYHSRNRRGIWLVPALGGLSRQLTEFGSKPAWSRDGDRIAFQSDAPADLSQAALGAMPPSTIWIVSSGGGGPRQITDIGVPSGGHGVPAWSPDGARIIFATYDLGLSELWSVSPRGDDLKRIWRGDVKFFDPVFSPDGRYLFASVASGNFHLWRLRLSDAGLVDGEPVEIANTGAALARHLTVAPDGKRIAYSLLAMNNNIGSVKISPSSRSTGQEVTGDPRLLTEDTYYRKTNHAFSPDGATIAFSRWQVGAAGEVWLMDADGGNPRQLLTEPAAVLGWLPAGGHVALIPKATPGRVLGMDGKGGKQTVAVFDQLPGLQFARLSPDGRQIAFNSRASGTINVWTASLAGGPPKQITFDPGMMGFPCWSPDGRSLAFEMKRGDDAYLVTIPRDGGEITQLTSGRGQSWPGSWSPDGDKIAFAGLRDGVWNIWWVSRRTRAQKQLTNNTKPNVYVRYPSWSPRGNQIIYEYAETSGNVWLIELK